ncbi:MAG: TonB-dependent receptor [candidate division Zixibacteria bacterium]|nr:TonB-dependent receptor [candidate division Zixibacteria bacterium]
MLGVLLLPLSSFAANVGHIKGTITDAKSGEPIIGASVQIEGTALGATTDFDGNFQINRLDPGIYKLKISTVGYNSVMVENVDVKIDQTFEVNQTMTESTTELDMVITVTEKRKIIDKSVVHNEVYFSEEEISKKPVQSVDALLEQVAGVQTNASGEVFVRGGRAGEVAYIVDGVPITDPLGGSGAVGANLSLVSGSIADIQIIKDGFDPEYGNALSGIVNIRSRVGSKDNTRLNVQYLTDDFGNQDLNKYSRNMDYLRFSLSGPDPLFTNKVLPSMGINFLKDKEFTYYFYADFDKNDGVYQMDNYDTPSTKRDWPALNFLGINIPERMYNRYTGQANFKFRPRQNLKFVLSLKKWYTKETLFAWDYRYTWATSPVRKTDRNSYSLEVTQSVSRDMNYELVLSMTEYELTQAPGDPNNPGKMLEPDEVLLNSEYESFTDNNDNGVYDAPEPLINLFPDTARYGNYTGGAYTIGEDLYYDNTQGGGGGIYANFRWNDNGILDNLEGEPFIDLNGNGVWDEGDDLEDRNGNGRLDAELVSSIGAATAEPYVDGDSIIGEPFTDLNANGVYDEGIDIFVQGPTTPPNMDLNHNGKYDGPQDPWSPPVPFEDRNGNGIYDAPDNQYQPGEPFTDLNGNGKYDQGGGSTFLGPNSHVTGISWEKREVKTYRGELKIVRQMGRHELKGGFAFQKDRVVYKSLEQPQVSYTGRPDTLNEYSDRGAFRDFYEYAPMQGTMYFRDKIEYGSMVASLGLRWDFFLQDAEELATTLRADDRGGLIEGDRHRISPRIGFSYPISDKAKVYFNYGHFFQLPGLTFMYARNTSSVNQSDVLGNPNLDYQKTIQYSFGVKYAMSADYAIDVQGYFKDEFDKVNQTEAYEGEVLRNRYRNSDYGRSRGFELTLEKRGGGLVNGSVSYTYAFAYGKESATQEQFDRFILSREPLSETPLDSDKRHSFKAGVTIWMPNTRKPRLFGLPIPNGWSMAIETVIESGRPFTPATSYPNLVISGLENPERNSLRYPATAVFDVRFSKEFRLAALDWEFIFWVENIFDSRNVVSVYTNTGRPDTQQNQNEVIRIGTAYDQNPYNWDYGRQLRLGLEVSI